MTVVAMRLASKARFGDTNRMAITSCEAVEQLLVLRTADSHAACMSAGTCALGYADPDINKTAMRVIQDGSISTLNPPEDVELSELLIKDNPWADSVKFARTGGESMSIAVRLARAYTKKKKFFFVAIMVGMIGIFQQI